MSEESENKINLNLGKILDTEDTTDSFDEKDVENNKGMAVLSYILPFIPYFANKESKFVKYHSTQGMNLLVISIVYGIVNAILTSLIKVKKAYTWLGYELGYYKVTPWWVTWPLAIIGIIIGAIAIIGIVNVCQGKAKELPLVNKLKLFK